MSQFLIKMLFNGCRTLRTSPTTGSLGFLRDPNVFLIRWISTGINRQSFTASFLVNSLGFSSRDALKVSSYLKLYGAENADQVIQFFKVRGFTKTQISRLVRGNPLVLTLNAEKTILPKLEFLESKGVSGPAIARVVSVVPNILSRSLDNQIIPSFDLLRNFLKSDEKLIAAVMRCSDILPRNFEKYYAPRIDILREHGVPDSIIAKIFMFGSKHPRVSTDDFRKIVEKVKDMGFDASRVNFVLAVHAFQSMSKPTWESKVDVYKKWGWSAEDLLHAFKTNPWCMTHSKDELTQCMDFFINQMGWRPCLLAKYPAIFGRSLKKRVVPRCSVFQVLLSKGLVEKEVSIRSLLGVTEEQFLQKFVLRYEAEAPELLKLYKEKLDLPSGPEGDDQV